MKTSLFTMIVTIMATTLAAAETVNFDDMKAGVPPRLDCNTNRRGHGEMVCRERRLGTEQPERIKAIRSGDVPDLFQERYEDPRRFR